LFGKRLIKSKKAYNNNMDATRITNTAMKRFYGYYNPNVAQLLFEAVSEHRQT